MSCNVGGLERSIRIGLGILLLGVGALGGLSAWASSVAYAVGGIALVTGAIGFCPAWRLLGLNTCATLHGKSR